MNHGRPRDSLLYLFDPLNSPSTPRRDVTTPDSDKENSEPLIAQSYDQLTMSTFFNRNYHIHPKNLNISTQKGPLVDVTMVDGALHSMVDGSPEEPTGEINLNDSEDDSDHEKVVIRPFTTPADSVIPPPPSPRTPLANIALQSDRIVVARKKVYTRHMLSARTAAPAETASSLHGSTMHAVTPAPQDVPLASVINNVNLSGVSFASCTRPHKTSFLDPRPVSIDLQSSFIQCPETSFDLLNDTVSFFGAGRKGENVVDGDEDSFDMSMQCRDAGTEAEAMKQMVSKFEKVALGSERSGIAGPLTTAMPTISESLNNTPEARDTPKISFGKGTPPNKLLSPVSLVAYDASRNEGSSERRLASASSPITSTLSSPVFVPPPPKTPSPPHTPPRTAREYAPILPALLAQPQVPALRIVKRKVHKKAGSSVSGSSGEEKGVNLNLNLVPGQKKGGFIARRVSAMGTLPPPPPLLLPSQKHIQGSSGTLGSAGAGGRVSGGFSTFAGPAGPGRSVVPSRVAVPSTSSASVVESGPVRYVGGPIRVPIEEQTAGEGRGVVRYGVKPGLQKASLGAGAGCGGLVARRVPISTQQGNSKVPAVLTSTGGVNGLKVPVWYGGAGAGAGIGGAATATALPRPVSRLLAPSGPGRVRMAAVGSGHGSVNGNGGGFARRVGHGQA